MKSKIINDDCIAHMATMPDECIDLVVTDSPYLMEYKTNHRKDKSHEFCKAIAGDSDPQLITDYIKECYRILKDNTAIYMFCSFHHIDFFKLTLEFHGFDIKSITIWDKGHHTAGDLKCAFGNRTEFIILANKGRSEIRGTRSHNIWSYNRVSGGTQTHQNQKPVALIEKCIRKHSDAGDIIFDGFLGSGTTAVAAINTGREYYCIELDVNYYSLAKNCIATMSTALLAF